MSVSDDLTGAALRQQGKAVALIMATAPSEHCTFSYVVVGRREKQGFRALPALITERKNGLVVAEARLDAGRYHVVSYRCSKPGQTAALGKGEDDGQQIFPIYAKSYASFTLEPGEIVNVGRLVVNSRERIHGAFDGTIIADLRVLEWAPDDLDAFRRRRPNLSAQMKTRLMVPAPVAAVPRGQIEAGCAEMRKLKIAGKIQNLPPRCAGPVRAVPPAKRGAR